jgi:hypothetical protein
MEFINTDEVILLKMRAGRDKGCYISLAERIRTGLAEWSAYPLFILRAVPGSGES